MIKMEQKSSDMKIGILASELPPANTNGTEVQTARLAKELGKIHDVTLFARKGSGHNANGFTLKEFRYINFPGIGFMSHINFAIRAIKKAKPDILQCMQLTPNGYAGVLAKKKFGIPIAAWVRGGDWYFAKREYFGKRIISRVINQSDIIFTQTEKIHQEILDEYPDARITVIHNGVDTSTESINPDENKFRIIYVSNFLKRKGTEHLLHVTKRLGRKYSLTLVGDGPEKKKMQRLAKKIELDARFVGKVPHKRINDYLRKASMLVLPSIEGEGLPNVILEAMSIGLPTVATDVGGLSDVIANKKTGIIVRPERDDELYEAINMLTEDDALRKNISRNAFMQSKKYSWPIVIKKLEKEYAKILKSSLSPL